LALAREVIEGHQGRIRVESAVGKGTTFTLKLPLAKPGTSVPVSTAIPAAEAAP
jgi:signal transduction histidine kinase